jgi:UDP-N-acetylglucosamine acyltransferase
MAAVHVAHDCRIGDRVIMANNATLGGHVTVQDNAILGGVCAVHQFTRIGRQAMVGGLAGVENDVIPYGMVLGNRARLIGLNLVGLKRRGVGRDELARIRQGYRELFHGEGHFAERLRVVRERYADQPRMAEIVAFIEGVGPRSICLPDQRQPG